MTMTFLANGYSVKYIPIDYAKRAGQSKFHPVKDTRRYGTQVVRMVLSYNPLRIFMPLGIALTLLGVGKVIYDLNQHDLHVATDTLVILFAAFQVIAIGLLADLVVRVSRDPRRGRARVGVRHGRVGRSLLPPLTTNAWLRFDAIKHGFATAAPRSVLEIGTGSGALATWIAARYDYTGIELDDTSRATTAVRLAAGGRGRVLAELAAVDGETFDAVCAFEVLEHIDDDAKALAQWREHLRDGGWLMLSVPAHSRKYGPWDTLAGHVRRYDRTAFTSLLTDAGFGIVSLRSYGAGLGQLLEMARNQVARRRDASAPETLEQRTSESGRLLQPHSSPLSLVYAAVAAPFRVVQAPFARSDTGTGYVLLARAS